MPCILPGPACSPGLAFSHPAKLSPDAAATGWSPPRTPESPRLAHNPFLRYRTEPPLRDNWPAKPESPAATARSFDGAPTRSIGRADRPPVATPVQTHALFRAIATRAYAR